MDILQLFAEEIGAELVEKATFSENAGKFLRSLSKYLTASDLAPLKGVQAVMTRNMTRGVGGHARLQGDKVTVVFNERLMGKVPNIWFASLVVHELRHVKQFKEKGAFGYGDKEAELDAYGAEITFLNRIRPKLTWLEQRQADERKKFASSMMAKVRGGTRVADAEVDEMFLKADDEDGVEGEIEEVVGTEPAPEKPSRAAKKVLRRVVENDIAVRGPKPRKKIKARRQTKMKKSEE